MVRHPSQSPYSDALQLVARGVELKTAARETKTNFEEVQRYSLEHCQEWDADVLDERTRLLGQSGAEAMTWPPPLSFGR